MTIRALSLLSALALLGFSPVEAGEGWDKERYERAIVGDSSANE